MSNKTNTTPATVSMSDISEVLKALKFDPKRFEVIRVYDNEEFLDPKKDDRKAYANIRETDTKRSVLKLWGHKSHIAVEASKSLRKREAIDVSKKCYKTDMDRNNNYICTTAASAITLSNDFLKQVDGLLAQSATATEKKAKQKELTA